MFVLYLVDVKHGLVFILMVDEKRLRLIVFFADGYSAQAFECKGGICMKDLCKAEGRKAAVVEGECLADVQERSQELNP